MGRPIGLPARSQKLNRPVLAAGEHAAAIRGKRDRADPLLVFERLPDPLALRQVPQGSGRGQVFLPPNPRPDRQRLAVGADRQAAPPTPPP